MTPRDHLRRHHREPVPQWLAGPDVAATPSVPGQASPDRPASPPRLFYPDDVPDGPVPRWLEARWLEAPDTSARPPRHGRRTLVEHFFGSRTVFYPGSGLDGHPVELFGSAHACHCFVHADYMVTREELHEELRSPGFRGYRIAALVGLSADDLVPGGWTPHLLPDEYREVKYGFTDPGQAFAELVVLERMAGFDDDHGPRRLAVLFLYADAVAAYDALYYQEAHGRRPPFAILLQDHGFGGQYTPFGADGLLHRVAERRGRLPDLLLVGEPPTKPWPGYARIPGLSPSVGGSMHRFDRYLHRREA